MNKIVLLISTFLITLFISGCGGTSPTAKNQQPDWINNHSEGVVATCDTHMNGNAAQEELAFDRALTMLGKQKNATIQSNTSSFQKESSGGYSSGSRTKTNVTSNAKVQSTIKATWRNPKNNRYYIWLIEQ